MNIMVLNKLLRFIVVFSLASGATKPFAQDAKDEALLKSILDNQYHDFKEILSDGYDPNQFIEGKVQSWLMCDVTRPGRLEFLKHAVKMGGDVNRIKTGISQSYSAPLMCAISYGNKTAFDFLLANGANPNIVVCQSCKPEHRDSPMSEALFSNEYQMAYELIPVTNVTKEELEVARLMLEDTRYWPKPEESQEEYRQKLVAYLESKGYELNIWSLEKENAGEWLPSYLRNK